VRILVEATTLPPGARMRLAAAGLALRGHELWWRGEPAPGPGIERAPDALRGAPQVIDLVIGGDERVPRTVLSAWLTRARAAVFEVRAERMRRWSAFDRWVWHSLYASGLLAGAEADEARQAARDIALDRLALWSDEAPPPVPEAEHADTEILERACERSLRRAARQRGGPAVFLDRDGTLVVEVGYLSDPEDIALLPGVPQGLRELQSAGRALVVVSNQSGVGRGLFPSSRVYAAMARLRRLLRAHDIELDAIYFCPHRPDAGCACRKPGTELLERAAEDLDLDLRRSAMVGDKRLDAATGHNAGALGLLVRTGYGRDEERRIGDGEFAPPDAVVDDVRAAAEWLLARGSGDER
jgi:D-glycero-D-manno-heptose 1,7-bisphosphate phosphatase